MTTNEIREILKLRIEEDLLKKEVSSLNKKLKIIKHKIDSIDCDHKYENGNSATISEFLHEECTICGKII